MPKRPKARAPGLQLDDDSPYRTCPTFLNGDYAMATLPEHPAAGASGKVRLHRAIKFDELGPGEHPCNWCGDPLSWDVDRNNPNYLIVDHVDGNPLNDRRSNLVASHNWCNGNRALIQALGIPWSAFTGTPTTRRPLLRGPGGSPSSEALKLAGTPSGVLPETPVIEVVGRTPWDALFVVPASLLEKYAFLAEVKP